VSATALAAFPVYYTYIYTIGIRRKKWKECVAAARIAGQKSPRTTFERAPETSYIEHTRSYLFLVPTIIDLNTQFDPHSQIYKNEFRLNAAQRSICLYPIATSLNQTRGSLSSLFAFCSLLCSECARDKC
jgi:hypothetical protein